MTQKIKKVIKLSLVLAIGTFSIMGSILDDNIEGQVILSGPVSGASYEISIPTTSKAFYRGVTTVGDSIDVNSSGLITIIDEIVDMNISTETLFDFTNSEFYIIQASGGVDVDVDLDGIWDKNPISNKGKLHIIISPDSLKSKVFKINILTEIIYQSMKESLSSKIYSSDEIKIMLDERAKKLLLTLENGGDLNGDALVNMDDIAFWNPILHKDKLKFDYKKEIVPIINMVRDNKDIYVAANQLLEEYIWKVESIEEDIEGDGNIDKKVTYSYDKNANLSKEELDIGADGSLDEIKLYSYDSQKNLSKLEIDLSGDDSIDETTIYNYNSDGDLTQVETTLLAGGLITTITYSYNKDRQITKEEKKRNIDGIFEILLYKYDFQNKTLSSKEILHPLEKSGDTLISYLYDEKLNLIEEHIDFNKDINIDSKVFYDYQINGDVEKRTENYDKGNWIIFSIQNYTSDGILIMDKSSFDGDIANRIKSYDKHGNEFKSEADIQPDGTYEKRVLTLNNYDKYGNLTEVINEDGKVVETRVWKKVK